jgi:hypothetical protein
LDGTKLIQCSSAVGTLASGQQIPLVEALAGSPDLLTFIPSEFGAPWRPRDFAIPELSFLAGKDAITDQARKLGVPVTIIKSGTFAHIFLAGYATSHFSRPRILCISR